MSYIFKTIVYSTNRTLRKIGLLVPSRRTLNFWMSKIKVATGLNQELMECIKEAAANFSVKDKDCAIVWDEMSVKELLEFNKSRDILEGIVDYGKFGRRLESATEVLVFMIRGLNASWKFPLSFYFSNHATPSEILQKLIEENINGAKICGLNVKIGICDMSFTNQKLYRDWFITTECPYKSFDGKRVYFIHDTPHLFKLVRNNLMKHDFIITPKNENLATKKIIKWSHITTFYKKDRRVASRTAPRLTNAHLFVKDYAKMKVGLAVQVLSHSVYAGMVSLCMLKIIPKQCLDTAFFIKNMDEMFDFLNMSTLLNDKFGRCALYFYSSIKKLDRFSQYLKAIEIPTMRKSPDFLRGLLQTINGIKLLGLDLKAEGYTFLFTRNIQQDCIERFFADSRAKGGDCRNPSAGQFRNNFRILFFANVVHTPRTGNTEITGELNNYAVRLSAALSRIHRLAPTSVAESTTLVNKNEAADFYSVKLNRKLKFGDEQESIVASYIGGAAVHSFLKNKNCNKCKLLLCNISGSLNDISREFILVKAKEFDPASSHLVYLEVSCKRFFEHVNKFFLKYVTETLKESGTGILSGIYERFILDQIVKKWINEVKDCTDHRETMLKYFLRSKLYRLIKDKNENIIQIRCWDQTRRDCRNQ